jgi:crotonobetaine/carnitine-CoA ligase
MLTYPHCESRFPREMSVLPRILEHQAEHRAESVLRGHPAVAECAVIGVKADERGSEDEVKACVILAEGHTTLDFADLMAWCDARMPAHMVPRNVEMLDKLPQTPSEKIKKKELRERGVTTATWDRLRGNVTVGGESAAKAGA